MTLEASPAFVKSKTWTVDRLAAGGLLAIKDRDLELDGDFLLGLKESMRGTVTIRVVQGARGLAESVIPVELLARNEWSAARFPQQVSVPVVIRWEMNGGKLGCAAEGAWAACGFVACRVDGSLVAL